MAIGLRIRNPENGAIILEITDKLTKVLGTFTTTNSDGSMSIPEFNDGEGFVIVYPSPIAVGRPSYDNVPSVSVVGNMIEWSFSGAGDNVPLRVTYGIYT